MALKCDIFDPLAAALNNGLAKRRNRVLTPLATSAAIGFAKCHPSQAPSVSISHRTRDLGGAQAAVISPAAIVEEGGDSVGEGQERRWRRWLDVGSAALSHA
jgi:hypothetical protein